MLSVNEVGLKRSLQDCIENYLSLRDLSVNGKAVAEKKFLFNTRKMNVARKKGAGELLTDTQVRRHTGA